MVVQALIPESTIEAFDVGILRGLARLVKQRATLSRLGVETASNSFHLGV